MRSYPPRGYARRVRSAHKEEPTLSARSGRSRFRRPWPMDATPERDASWRMCACLCVPPRSHPRRGPCSALRHAARIARSLERVEMSLGCARCGACVVTLLAGASAAPAERERAGGAGSAGLGRWMRPGVARIARRSCALVGTPTRSHPQKGPLFRAPASLAVIRTWRNARRRTYAELP